MLDAQRANITWNRINIYTVRPFRNTGVKFVREERFCASIDRIGAGALSNNSHLSVKARRVHTGKPDGLVSNSPASNCEVIEVYGIASACQPIDLEIRKQHLAPPQRE